MKKIFLIVALLCTTIASAQQKQDSVKTALLIVDIQEFYFPAEGRPGLVNAEAASLVAKEVLQIFRENGQLVIHVRHNAARGFEIHKNVEPLPGEKVITKEKVNSFARTDLLKYLRGNEITNLVVIGMQTQMCLEAAVRAASDYGFICTVVHDACATRDLKFGDKIIKAQDVHAAVLATLSDGRYAKVIDLTEFKQNYAPGK